MVLWEYGIYVEFPHASTIGIPSALVTHSNLAVRAGEIRCSITQWASGALFRWMDNGGKTNKEIDPSNLKGIKEARMKYFKKGLALFTTIRDHIGW